MSHRVCFVCPHIYGYFNSSVGYTGGGAERQIYLMSTHLSDTFDVHVVVGDHGQPALEKREGVTLHRAYPLTDRKNIFQPIKHFWLLGRAMQRADADVYIHRGSPRNAAANYLWARMLSRKWIYNIANDANITSRPRSLAWPLRALFAHAIRNADGLIAQTTHQQTLLQERYDVSSTVVPNGYPLADCYPPFEEREFFLWVGRLNQDQKRPHLFLDVAEKLPEKKFELIGPKGDDDEYVEHLMERIERLENVEYRGTVSPDQISEYYKRAVALVSTSKYEGFPNTFLEAWRVQTPVLSLSIDARRYIDIEDYYSGYCEGRLGNIISGCKRIYESEKCWGSFSSRSRKIFEFSLSISSSAEKYSNAINYFV